MYGSPFLGPLALMSYAVVVVALGYVAAHYSGEGMIKLPLKKAPGISLSTLPVPAHSSRASLVTRLARGVKTVKTAALTLRAKQLPRLPSLRGWSNISKFLTRRWRRRIALDQLPTTATLDEAPLPPDTSSETPLLVDYTTSNVCSPVIPLRALGTATPPPTLRSMTPFQGSEPGVLATPLLAAASSISSDPPPLPLTPPPRHGLAPRFEPVSPFSSPRSEATKPREVVGFSDVYSPNVIYPQSRSRTPSPISHNPNFLSTSPRLPFGHHRRTRSLGGVNVRRVTLPLIPSSLLHGAGAFAPGTYEVALEMGTVKARPRASRSTELLIDLEDGIGTKAPPVQDPAEPLVDLESEWSAVDLDASPSPSSGSVPTPVSIGPRSHSFPSLASPTSSPATDDHILMRESNHPETNNAWRDWGNGVSIEGRVRDVVYDEFEGEVKATTVPFPSFDDPFDDVYAGEANLDVFDDPFTEPVHGYAPGSPPSLGAESFVGGRGADDAVGDVDVGVLETELRGDEEAMEEAVDEDEGEDEGEEEEEEAQDLEEQLDEPEVEQVGRKEDVRLAQSQMPTPPASPPFSRSRLPSKVDDGTCAPVEITIGEEAAKEEDDQNCEEQDLDAKSETSSSSSVLGEVEVDEKEDCEFADPVPAAEPPVSPSVLDGLEGDKVVEGISTFVELQQRESPLSSPELSPCCDDVGAALDDTQADEDSNNVLDESDDKSLLADDPPLPTISDLPPQVMDMVIKNDEYLETSKAKPEWCIRAEEAPRLGLATDPEQRDEATTQKTTPELLKDDPADESVPGAFPGTSSPQPKEPISTTTLSPPKNRTEPSSNQLRQRVRTVSSIDTSSFAAAVVSIRRKPEPLDVALTMQMRPGLGAGADPAWMVRFMMAVFGWVAVTISAGID